MQPTHRAPSLVSAAALAVTCTACSHNGPTTTTMVPEAEDLEDATTGSLVSISGTVVEAGDEGFRLDYGEGEIVVEMDDFDWWDEGKSIIENDDVIVHGRMDDDFYDARTVEASNVYVKGLGTQFFASSADEEGYVMIPANFDFGNPTVELSGTVARINGRQFELKTGSGTVDVDTRLLPYNPLDDEGYQSIDVGDRVRVLGELEPELFENQDLAATMIVTLQSGPTGT